MQKLSGEPPIGCMRTLTSPEIMSWLCMQQKASMTTPPLSFQQPPSSFSPLLQRDFSQVESTPASSLYFPKWNSTVGSPSEVARAYRQVFNKLDSILNWHPFKPEATSTPKDLTQVGVGSARQTLHLSLAPQAKSCWPNSPQQASWKYR